MILGKCTLSDTLKNVVYRRIIFMCFSAKYAIAVNTQKKKKKVLNLEKGFAVSTPTFSESLMHLITIATLTKGTLYNVDAT